MKAIAESDIKRRLERDNPWWASKKGHPVLPTENKYPRRVYFSPFRDAALNYRVRRATVLLGPRRVGKTVIVKQLIAESIFSGIEPLSILYASIDTPVYSGISLEKFLEHLPNRKKKSQKIVFFDEIQYLKDWETHLKDLVDNYHDIKFVVTGSAAAALRLKSRESGAGRFSDFMLPPLTFYEFLAFQKADSGVIDPVKSESGSKFYTTNQIDEINKHFVDYLNFGGYPEVVLNEDIRADPEKFINADIIEKVLLKDLPNLYGIKDTIKLNKLFSFLAYNAGSEASLDNISKEAGLPKPTVKSYIEYLESAFLIIKVPNVDENCRSLDRSHNFKIYLNNPSMRAALFAPVAYDDSMQIGHLAECAVFSQWQHSLAFRRLRYARWRNEAEVDVVHLLEANEKPGWIGEIKWSDRIKQNLYHSTRAMTALLKRHKSIEHGFFTTKSHSDWITIEDRQIQVLPTAMYCYTVGRNITQSLVRPVPPKNIPAQKVTKGSS